MSELVVILNALILLGVVVSAILAVHCEKLLSSVIALGVTGIFAAAEFLLLHAPDVYMQKLAVGPGYKKGVVELDATPADNVKRLAQAKGVEPGAITVLMVNVPVVAPEVNVPLKPTDNTSPAPTT